MENKLKELRLAQRLTLQDTAEALQLAKNTYRQYETGERNMKPEIMIKIAEFFNVSVDELFLHRLPSRYISVSADEKKMLTQYASLTPEHKHVIRIVLNSLAQTGETIQRSDGGFRMASRTSGEETPEAEHYLPPFDIDEESTDIPDDI